MKNSPARALEALERDLRGMAERVEAQVDAALAALVRRDPVLAEEVIRSDDEVDAWDLRIEEAGLALLASGRLEGEGLRLVVAALRIDGQLERIGDLAVNIAERAIGLAARPALGELSLIASMASLVHDVVKAAVRALATRDAGMARRVLEMDRPIDESHRRAFAALEAAMRASPETIERAVQLLSCSRHLERVGDHAQNVAEDAIFLVEGAVVRHRRVARPVSEAILIAS